ncbi:MAG: hypothetical protein ACFFCI_16220 [Promethearchaeota archaeon]
MNEIKDIVDDISISALESNIKIASIAIVSDSGNLVYQTENWDLTDYIKSIINVIQGEKTFILNKIAFSVVDTKVEGIIATNNSGMGHVILVRFQGGIIVSYAMPQADPSRALEFLKTHIKSLNGKV